jgi:hypothetical protein
MNFSSKQNFISGLCGVLVLALVGSLGWFNDLSPAPSAPVQQVQFVGSESAAPQNYQTVSAWYKSKHWWKSNAPIIGGAGGGALVGGLVGGGTGAIVGGAVGGAGGYAYKRYRHHQHHEQSYRNGKYQYHH